jgi:hypothetical protein
MCEAVQIELHLFTKRILNAIRSDTTQNTFSNIVFSTLVDILAPKNPRRNALPINSWYFSYFFTVKK